MPVLEKQCGDCKHVLPIEMFYKNKHKKDGFRSICKKCDHLRRQNSAKLNPVMRQTGSILCHARQRAKQKNLPFDIDLNYLRSIVPTHCPVLGVPLEWSAIRQNGGVALPNSPSLDRIDPERGYVKGNVWIISHRANSIKNDATHEELKLVTKAVGEAIVNSLEF